MTSLNGSAVCVVVELNRILEEYPDISTQMCDTLKDIQALDERFEKTGGVFFHATADAFETAKAFTRVHVEQYRETSRPSLPALAIHHAECMGLDKNSAVYKAMILIAIRAEKKMAANPHYHSKFHYMDVAAVTANLLEKNNAMLKAGDAGAVPLTAEEQGLVFLTSIGHDLEHDGHDNPQENPVFNEEKSFAIMLPLLKAAGLSDDDIAKVQTMITTTSPDGGISMLKRAARAHRRGEAVDFSKTDAGNRFPILRTLADDPPLTQMAAMILDADLYASSSAGLKSSQLMGRLFTAEKRETGINIDLTTDESHKGFLDCIVEDGPASNAGRILFREAFEAMRDQTAFRISRKNQAGPKL